MPHGDCTQFRFIFVFSVVQFRSFVVLREIHYSWYHCNLFLSLLTVCCSVLFTLTLVTAPLSAASLAKWSRRPPLERMIRGSSPACAVGFFRVESYQSLCLDILVTLPGYPGHSAWISRSLLDIPVTLSGYPGRLLCLDIPVTV